MGYSYVKVSPESIFGFYFHCKFSMVEYEIFRILGTMLFVQIN